MGFHTFVGLVLIAAAPLLAQQQPPRRPRLPEGADTNSARSYYQLGLQQLRNRPRDAAAAFYWASRLEPAAPEPWYGQRVALLLSNEARLWGYMDRSRSAITSPEVMRIDSLFLKALMIDPMFHQNLNGQMAMQYLTRRIRQEARNAGVNLNDETGLEQALESYANRCCPDYAGMLAYSRGQFDFALSSWGLAINREPSFWPYHEERANAFYQLGRMDSARSQIETLIEKATTADTSVQRFVYQSKAQWRYALGRILERDQRWNEARDAYQQTLIEDLGYYPAHIRLAFIALRSRDTATALTEFGRAAAIAEGEYITRVAYGEALLNAGRVDSAIVHLRQAIVLEPHAPVARRLLARALDRAGDTAGAREAYRVYIAMARRDDANLALARQRLEALGN